MIFKGEELIPCHLLTYLDKARLEEAAIHSLVREVGIEAASKKATISTTTDPNGNIKVTVRMVAMTIASFKTIYVTLAELVENVEDVYVKLTLKRVLAILAGHMEEHEKSNAR